MIDGGHAAETGWMSAWTDEPKNFDSIERDALVWLRADLGEYLRFHELDGGHLPENFAFTPTPNSFDDDARVKGLRRIGYLSYSVFVNLAIARRSAESLPGEFVDVLEVYDHVSRVALRIGAAIDIARLLEDEHASVFGKDGVLRKPGKTPHHAALKTALDDTDAYNNYLKHTGLPPLRVESVAGDDIVLVASKLDRSALSVKNTSPWKVANPDAPVRDQAQAAVQTSLVAFNAYYKALADRTTARLQDWKLTLKAAPTGIGAFAVVEDGYVASKLQMPRSGSV